MLNNKKCGVAILFLMVMCFLAGQYHVFYKTTQKNDPKKSLVIDKTVLISARKSYTQRFRIALNQLSYRNLIDFQLLRETKSTEGSDFKLSYLDSEVNDLVIRSFVFGFNTSTATEKLAPENVLELRDEDKYNTTTITYPIMIE